MTKQYHDWYHYRRQVKLIVGVTIFGFSSRVMCAVIALRVQFAFRCYRGGAGSELHGGDFKSRLWLHIPVSYVDDGCLV